MENFRTFWRKTEPLFKHKIEVTLLGGDNIVIQYAIGGTFPQWASKVGNTSVSGSLDVKFVEGVSLANVVIDFVEDEKLFIGKFYGRWMTEVTNDGRTFSYANSYKKTLCVKLRSGLTLVYGGAFPISIAPAEMSGRGAILVRRIEFSVDNVVLDEV